MGCGNSKSSAPSPNKKPSKKEPTPNPILSPQRKRTVEPPPDVSDRNDQEDKDAVMWMRSNDTQTLKKKMKR